MPTALSSAARTMNTRKTPESSTLSLVRCSTSSQTTASAGAPGACSSASSAAVESARSTLSRLIEPCSWISRARRSEMIRLASSRATSQRITSPSGRWAASCRTMMLTTASVRSSTSRTLPVRSGGETIRRWTMRRAPYPRAPIAPLGLGRMQDRLQILRTSHSAAWSQIRADAHPLGRTLRVPSDPLPSLTNTCSPRRPPAARRSARSASWCARLSIRPRSSRRWVRHRLRSARRTGPPPPPHAITRTAGHSVVNREGADPVRSRLARRSASRRYPINRLTAPDHRPPAPGLGGRARRTGSSSNALGPPAGGPSAWGGPAARRGSGT